MYSCVVARVGGRLTRIVRGRGQGGLVFGWGEVAEGFVQAFLVVPGHPLSGCQLDLVDAAPGPASACSELVASRRSPESICDLAANDAPTARLGCPLGRGWINSQPMSTTAGRVELRLWQPPPPNLQLPG